MDQDVRTPGFLDGVVMYVPERVVVEFKPTMTGHSIERLMMELGLDAAVHLHRRSTYTVQVPVGEEVDWRNRFRQMKDVVRLSYRERTASNIRPAQFPAIGDAGYEPGKLLVTVALEHKPTVISWLEQGHGCKVGRQFLRDGKAVLTVEVGHGHEEQLKQLVQNWIFVQSVERPVLLPKT